MVHLLLIDDEPELLQDKMRLLYPAPHHEVQVAYSGGDGLKCISVATPDVILLDLRLPDHSGLEVLNHIREIDARIPVIFVTVSRSASDTIEAMRRGAYDYLLKPVDVQNLHRVVGAAIKVSHLMNQRETLAESLTGDDLQSDSIVGSCPAMCEVYKAIGRVAAQDVPVLIMGETGTGKELVARAICRHGQRAEEPFLTINCAAIPENLLESELFGHEKGAFTGADRLRIGKFEQCNGGTLFLDEIGDMPLHLQAKILRFLQEQAFERVGGNETLRTNVRIIAATHRDLKSWSEIGKFRHDLYYRLGVFIVQLPPLRERGDDLDVLCRHFLRCFSLALGREIRQIAPETLTLLREYSWPGNIRELQSILKQSLLKASGSVLLTTFLPDLFATNGKPIASASTDIETNAEPIVVRQQITAEVRDLYAETHREMDRQLLSRVMEYTRGNVQQAALLLGIARQTLRWKLRDLGLSVVRSIESDEEELA